MNTALQRVQIAGGGLAGLSLALALRRRGLPVAVHEAGTYPRQRVCGEFISGLDTGTIEELKLAPFLKEAMPHRDVAWYRGDRMIWKQRLPQTAYAISRFELDARLAHAFEKEHGELLTRTRVDGKSGEGWIDATGRRRTDTAWIGLKLHVRGFALECGLELHLGADAYIGLCAIPGGEVNVCGLFRRRSVSGDTRLKLLLSYLRACGLDALAGRLDAAEACEGSEAAVAGLGFSPLRETSQGIMLGDAQGMLPPFMGNGMAAAFQSAAIAIEPVVRWSQGTQSWPETCAVVRRRLRRRFFIRAHLGAAMHAFLLSPSRQSWIAALAARQCLPTNLLYRCLH